MEPEPTDPHKTQDEELNAALDANTPDEDLGELGVQHRRLARIDEYEDAATSRSNPYAAIIGAGTADLQRIQDYISAAILDELDSRPDQLAAVRELIPEIRLTLQVRNAIETDLEFQSDDAGQSAALPCCTRAKGLASKAETRNHDLVPKRWMGNG